MTTETISASDLSNALGMAVELINQLQEENLRLRLSIGLLEKRKRGRPRKIPPSKVSKALASNPKPGKAWLKKLDLIKAVHGLKTDKAAIERWAIDVATASGFSNYRLGDKDVRSHLKTLRNLTSVARQSRVPN